MTVTAERSDRDNNGGNHSNTRVLLMTTSASASIAESMVARWAAHPGQSPPQSAQSFCDLRKCFHGLIAATDRMSSGYMEGSKYLDELDYQNSLDALTDKLQAVCVNLSMLRSTRRDHLTLKISALLYLLPEEAEAEIKLTRSLLADLEARQFCLSSSGGQ